MTLSSGMVIDRYTVVGLIGSGGMADVYEVQHNLLRSNHALKVLRTRDARVAERLVMEGRVQAGLRHPNVLTVTDLVTVHGSPGLVMELVRGPTLYDWLHNGHLTQREAAAVGRDIAEGVAAAHRAGVVHRDLKPANVLLDRTQSRVTPKVADFGLVQLIESKVSRLTGSPAFMAPEQARGQVDQDHRVDLFALGSLLFELFSGKRAYEGSGRDLIRRIAGGELPNFDEVPAALQGLVVGLMRGDPGQRLTMPEILGPLSALAGNTDDLARRIGGEAPTLELSAPSHSSSQETLDLDEISPELPALSMLPVGVPLLGRDIDLAEVERLLGAASLVTVLGPGGMGKTQLALAAAHGAQRRGVAAVFIDLTAARDSEAVRTAVARELGCDEAKLEVVLERRSPLRVVLDNAEQVVGPVAALADGWSRIRGVQLLITSRERLRTTTEQVLDLGPLDRTAAVALFQRRAQAAGARLTEADAELVEQIVERLDCLPLPIELAASRARVLPLRRLVQRLTDRLRLLSGSQRSLRAVLDSSWELLSDAEQNTLVQCAVFEGSFDFEAAEAVVQPAEGEWVEELLAELLDKSLLRLEGERWSMFQTIREYARDRSGSSVARERHGEWYATRAREATDGLDLPVEVGDIKAFRLDLDDLRGIAGDSGRRADHRGWALTGLFAAGQVPSHSALIGVAEALRPACEPGLSDRLGFWVANATFKRGETERAAAMAEELEDADPAVVLRVLRLQGRIAARRGDLEGERRYLDACEAKARAYGDDGILTDIAISIAISMWERGEASDARRVLESARRKVQDRDAGREMRVVHNLAVLIHETEDAKLALPLYERACELNAELGDSQFAAMATASLAIAYADIGDLHTAERLYGDAVAANAAIGRVVGEAIAEGNRGNTLLELGRRSDALALLRRAVKRARKAGDERVACYFESTIALEAALDGDLNRAQQLLEQGLEVLDAAGDVRGAALSRIWYGLVALHSGKPDVALGRLGAPLPDDAGYASLRALIEQEAERQLKGVETTPPGGPETMERRLVQRHLIAIRHR